MNSFLQDFRYGVRLLARSPGFTAVAVLALALGIGANSAIFSVVYASLLRPLPYPDSGRLVLIWDQLLKLGLKNFPTTFATFADYLERNQVFDGMAAYQPADMNLASGDDSAPPERLPALQVSANLFPMLGVQPLHGRLFTASDTQPGRDHIAVLSHALWRRRFGSDPRVIGGTVTLDGNLFTVAGVLPPEFAFAAASAELYTPIAFEADPQRTRGALRILARLKSAVSIEQAQANMSAIASRLASEHRLYRGPRGEDPGYAVAVVGLREQVYGGVRTGLLALLGAVSCLLLIACLNVANLLLARSAGRRREIAIREALGAGRARLMRQLLTESVPLALAGGSLGLLLASWGVDALVALSPASFAPAQKIAVDGVAVAFTTLLSLASAFVFGLAPALNASRRDRAWLALRDGGRASGGATSLRLRKVLIAVEVALSMVLLVAAGLLVQSFIRLQSINPGFDAGQLLTMRVTLPASSYSENHQIVGFYERVMARVLGLPEVGAASLVSRLPLSGGRGGDPFSIEGRPWNPSGATPQFAVFQSIGERYFRTMRIPLLAGRELEARDAAGAAPVVVVNETLARGFFGGVPGAIGQRVVMGAPRPGVSWMTITGVVGDVHNSGLDVAPIPQIYASQMQSPSRSMHLVIRTTAPDAAGVAAVVARQVAAVDPAQPVYDVRTMRQRLDATVAQPRFQSVLLGFFASVALLLAAVGIYGVVAHAVAQRTREIGIRLALGAEPHEVRRMVVAGGMAPVAIGIAVGLPAAAVVSRTLSTLLYNVTAIDPLTFAGAALLLASIALAASYLPARRATRVDPLSSLRAE